MQFSALLLTVATLATPALSQAVHGSEERGKMGPVAFLWPQDRPWTAADQHIAPCGSRSGPISNRTNFPTTNGAVALTIADPSYDIVFRIAYVPNPTSQSQFSELSHAALKVQPGHQCYTLKSLRADILDSQLATIQLEYRSTENNKNTTYYACADITFIPAVKMTEQIPCFNVTSEGFVAPATTSSSGSRASSTAQANAAISKSSIVGLNLLAAAGLTLLGFFL